MADRVSRKIGAGKPRAKAATKPKTRGAKKAPSKSKKAAPKRKLAVKAKRRRAAPKPVVKRYEIAPLIDCEAALAQATQRLMELDPEIVARMIEIGGPPPLRRREPGFSGMAAIIVSQQVSVASANAIFGRLEGRLAPLDARTVIAADDEALRGCGVSSPKIRALRALAKAVSEEGLDLEALGALSAPDAHDALVRVSGVGPWTADIFLLFCLGHPDAFPQGDLALQEAARLALGLKKRPDARKLEAIAERWRPFRGVAARMLWAFYREVKQRSGMALANASG